ncbi:hypothetical protein [Bradyrhizobium ontarionense]
MTIVVAVGLTSAVCYGLLVRADRRRRTGRRSLVDTTGSDSGGGWTEGSGFSFSSWFSNTTTDAMGNPIDGGSGSSDGGSDGGGGGGDGGGGD